MSAGGAAPEPPAPLSFSYARSVAPMIWALAALATLELFAVHLLVALLWSHAVAALLSLVTGGSILWLVLLVGSFASRPVLVIEEEVVMRVGTLRSVTVPRSSIEAVETAFPPGFTKAPGVLNLALLAYPNVALRLSAPLPGLSRRGAPVRRIAHRLDDPAAFLSALAAVAD